MRRHWRVFHEPLLWCHHSYGGTHSYGWFVRENPNLKWMMTGGSSISGSLRRSLRAVERRGLVACEDLSGCGSFSEVSGRRRAGIDVWSLGGAQGLDGETARRFCTQEARCWSSIPHFDVWCSAVLTERDSFCTAMVVESHQVSQEFHGFSNGLSLQSMSFFRVWRLRTSIWLRCCKERTCPPASSSCRWGGATAGLGASH